MFRCFHLFCYVSSHHCRRKDDVMPFFPFPPLPLTPFFSMCFARKQGFFFQLERKDGRGMTRGGFRSIIFEGLFFLLVNCRCLQKYPFAFLNEERKGRGNASAQGCGKKQGGLVAGGWKAIIECNGLCPSPSKGALLHFFLASTPRLLYWNLLSAFNAARAHGTS